MAIALSQWDCEGGALQSAWIRDRRQCATFTVQSAFVPYRAPNEISSHTDSLAG